MAYQGKNFKPRFNKDAESKYYRPKLYTFFSQGNSFVFNPNKTTSYDGRLMTLLDLHKQEVKFRNSKDVFILNEVGEVLALD